MLQTQEPVAILEGLIDQFYHSPEITKDLKSARSMILQMQNKTSNISETVNSFFETCLSKANSSQTYIPRKICVENILTARLKWTISEREEFNSLRRRTASPRFLYGVILPCLTGNEPDLAIGIVLNTLLPPTDRLRGRWTFERWKAISVNCMLYGWACVAIAFIFCATAIAIRGSEPTLAAIHVFLYFDSTDDWCFDYLQI